MKRLLLFILLLSTSLLSVMAQKDMNVASVFDGKIIPRKQMVETVVKGEQAQRYKLSLFHSLKMEAGDEECREIEELVLKDCGGLNAPSVQEYGMKEGYLSYLITKLPSRHDDQVYLCYQCYRNEEGKLCITLVYMEGPATMKDLYKMFKTEKKK